MEEEKAIRSIRPVDSSRRRRHRRRRTITAAVGAMILIFSLVGIGVVAYSLIGAGYRTVKSYLGPSETPAFFAGYIQPVVALDPKPFAKIGEADPDWMLETAVWSAAKTGSENGVYSFDEQGRVVVPAADVQKSFEQFFGKTVKPEFHSFTQNDTSFEYDAKGKSFLIPTSAIYSIFTPKVSKVVRHGSQVTLTVQYLPSTGWTQKPGSPATPPAPSKTMLYILTGSRGRYAISAVKVAPVTSSSASAASSTASGSSAAAVSAAG